MTLRDGEGELVAGGSAFLNLAAQGQLARFPDQIFEGKGIDFSNFRGTLQASAELPLVGMAIRVSPSEFATLPVTRMN